MSVELIEQEVIHIHVCWVHIVEGSCVRTEHPVSLQYRQNYIQWGLKGTFKICLVSLNPFGACFHCDQLESIQRTLPGYVPYHQKNHLLGFHTLRSMTTQHSPGSHQFSLQVLTQYSDSTHSPACFQTAPHPSGTNRTFPFSPQAVRMGVVSETSTDLTCPCKTRASGSKQGQRRATSPVASHSKIEYHQCCFQFSPGFSNFWCVDLLWVCDWLQHLISLCTALGHWRVLTEFAQVNANVHIFAFCCQYTTRRCKFYSNLTFF